VKLRVRYGLLVYGMVVATMALIFIVMRPPLGDLLYLAGLLTLTGTASVIIGFIAQRYGWWRNIPRLRDAVIIGYILAVVLTLINVVITAQLMFVNAHDFALSTLLLIFAGGISVAFGYFVSGSITERVQELNKAANEIKEGNLQARVSMDGEDEIAELAEAFNMMAERLERSAMEAEALNMAKQHLIAGASHDLRTPLASVRAMIDALADGIVDDEETIQRYYDQSRTQISRMSRLIDDLLELARLDIDHISVEREPGYLSDLVSDTLAAFSARARENAVTLEGNVDPDVDPVWMATHQISRVLYNLLENALRHTPEGGTIGINVRRDNGTALVEVKDSGHGIPKEDLPFVFEHFYRGEKSRSSNDGGAGLGLAIVKRLVEAHGGTINVDSEVGKGTTLKFSLPRELSNSGSSR